MQLKRIQGSFFRNYTKFTLTPSATNTIVYGENGSGKTSLLEAIYLLGSGKSFRTSRLQRLLQMGCEEFVLYAEFSLGGHVYRAGLSRNAQQFTGIRLNGESVASLGELAKSFPVQVFHSNSVDLIYGAAELRRRFIDWGLFHVEPEFHGLWRQLNKVVQQHNILLKEYSLNKEELAPWDKQLVWVSAKISALRQQHVDALLPYLQDMLPIFASDTRLQFSLYQGWPKKESLGQLLQDSYAADRQRGFPSRGAHRADLKLTIEKLPVRDILSRWQIKTLTVLLGLAKLHYLVNEKGLKCLVLVDDLAAELDAHHMHHVVTQLTALGLQTIYTALTPKDLPAALLSDEELSVFHVEHDIQTDVDES